MTMAVDLPVQTLTTQERFNLALRAIRATGVQTKMNYSSCCRSCANLGTEPYVASFGGQGRAYGWVQGVMYTRGRIAKVKRQSGIAKPSLGWMGTEGRVNNVYLEFNDLSAAQIAVDSFKAEGFVVDWDGAENNCVVIKMP